jgi:hypothetical protein
MNKIPCLYAIVRFAPFVETGEFANTGVVLLAPQHRYFGYRLMDNRYARVTHFFEPLDGKVVRNTMRTLKEELARAAALLKAHGFDKRMKHNDIDFAKTLFNEIIRPRETTVKFGEPRVVLVDDPKAKLDELYRHYVERGFVNKEYQEAALEKGMRKLFADAKIGDRFMRADVGNDEYHAAFPFVEKDANVALKAIKPLHLNHREPSKIIDHGGQWLVRVQALKKRNLLPTRVLFAVDAPTQNDQRGRHAREVVADLEALGVTVLPIADRQHVLDFATGS